MICVIETRIDEFFSDNDEPVRLKISVINQIITKVQDKRLNVSDVKEINNARFACGVTEI